MHKPLYVWHKEIFFYYYLFKLFFTIHTHETSKHAKYI